MIDELRVRNVALIEDATIRPAAGLTVLTGETGTGKSALLSSLKLLMGERADAGAIREGSDGLEVDGRLFVCGGDPDGTVVRRRVESTGRGRVEVDGRMASVRELANGVGATIDICGQHEHQRLLQVATHVDLLDAWAGEAAADALARYQQALHAARDAADELERVREMSRAADGRVEEADFVLRKIDEVAPKAGEYEELEETLPKAEHAEALLRAAAEAREGIVGDGGVEDALSGIVGTLRDAARFDPALGRFADTLESSLIDIEDVTAGLREYQDGVDFDPEALDRLQARMAQLQGLLRSYGPRMEDVLERRDKAAELVEAARDGGERIARAQEALDAAEKDLAAAADALDGVRAKAAPGLAAAVTEQMAFLEMGTAELEVASERLPRAQWTSQGPSKVELMYRPAAGLTARPLRKIASGGEISRVMLACKVVLGNADSTETLVFDEVDAGVGGATAVALAQVLARLARTHQVIVVTHLAQVAVMADAHYVVTKVGSDVPRTMLSQVEGQDRVREVARMLSGDQSEASLDHARQMLAEAEEARSQEA
ncbi:DNA repair protein RecN [Parafannyhessea umbonata]|uniref:DNA repair protein RecN n=1 Tax=Parafannyhessea umbonata TaxID=604330 RepID=A0A1G6HNT1_9ACTN|nr:DNA repair protein RecN [Parafannyhessea umbonata]SDB95788.1 DNA repair protein RecN (Recombination protein N) [Parafannyhessea umbonata]